MEKYRFWFEKASSREGSFRSREHKLESDGSDQTVPQPLDQPAYDPWADWYNAGLDPEPFTDPFAPQAGQEAYFNYGVDPGFQPAEYGEASPWPSIPWDQAAHFPWFPEGAEPQDRPGEWSTGERVEDQPGQDETGDEKKRARESENFIIADAEIPGGGEDPTAAYLFGARVEEQGWTGVSAPWPAETAETSGRSVVQASGGEGETEFDGEIERIEENETKGEVTPKEEMELKEEREWQAVTATKGEAGLSTETGETGGREEPEGKVENRPGEETMGNAADGEEGQSGEERETPSSAETGGKAQPGSPNETGDEEKSKEGRRIIVWRNFPAKGL